MNRTNSCIFLSYLRSAINYGIDNINSLLSVNSFNERVKLLHEKSYLKESLSYYMKSPLSRVVQYYWYFSALSKSFHQRDKIQLTGAETQDALQIMAIGGTFKYILFETRKFMQTPLCNPFSVLLKLNESLYLKSFTLCVPYRKLLCKRIIMIYLVSSVLSMSLCIVQMTLYSLSDTVP